MIINCINCNKNFEVESSLIPQEGRTLQCGSCKHEWFYSNNRSNETELKPEIPTAVIKKVDLELEPSFFEKKKVESNSEIKKEFSTEDTIQIPEYNEVDEKNSESYKNQINNNKPKIKKFRYEKILSFILVLIVSITALIIVLDTFKTPLSNIVPDIEFILYNLYEIIKDIKSFLMDLI